MGIRTISNGTFMETAREWERIQDVNKIVENKGSPGRTACLSGGVVHRSDRTDARKSSMWIEGRCISPLYTWQDGRGNVPDEQGKTLTEMVQEKGITVFTGYGLVTHLEPAVRRSTGRSGRDLYYRRLSGHVSDRTETAPSTCQQCSEPWIL